MRRLCGAFLLILGMSAPFLNHVGAQNGALKNPRADKHKNRAHELPAVTQPSQEPPTVPLSLYQSEQSNLLEALRTIHAQEEAPAKQNRPQYEPRHAPSVLAQFD